MSQDSTTRRRAILSLALPTIGGMTSQNLLNLVDTAMVGALGPASLAGVGFASFLNFFAFAGIAGLASAVQAIAARRYGAGRMAETALSLNGGIFIAICIGIPLSALLVLLAPWFFPLLNDDPAVIAEGLPFLQYRLLGIAAVGMNFCFRGYWNAIHKAKVYLFTLLVIHALNVFFNYALIFGHFGMPALGAKGAGIGTTLAIWIGTLWYLAYSWRTQRANGFLRQIPDREQLRSLLKLGIPSSLQQLFFAAGFAVLFWILGKVGTAELAVANVLVNITLVAILPAMGFGLAAASLVGHALGRNDLHDAHRWAWDVVKLGSVALCLLALPMLIMPRSVLTLFLHQAALLDLGEWPLRLVGVGIAIDGAGIILMQALLGAGASASVMRAAIGLQWGIFLPVAWLLGPVLGYGLLAIWVAFITYRGAQSLLFLWLWERRDWGVIRV